MWRLLAFLVLFCSAHAMAVEEPKHDLLVADGAFSIRQYSPMIVAEVTVQGEMREAGSRGFRPLADFIFGNNSVATEIEMTAPVARTAAPRNQDTSVKIEMTAPVTRVETDTNQWVVSFVMPEHWTIDTLPKPNNSDVNIREVVSEMVAVVKFSGRSTELKHREKQKELEAWIQDSGYEIIGEPRYAGYSPPWTPAELRRNEVMIPVALER